MDLDDDELKATRRMNGSDKNVGSIVEDIRALEKMLKIIKEQKEIIEYAGGYCENCNQDIKVLENAIQTIKAYKEKEQIEEEHKKINGELREKVKQLEEENEFLKLKERNRVLGRYGEIEVHELINKTLADDYIPVSLVEEKIEEYTKLLKNCNRFSDVDRMKSINERILAYKELLEKGK